ncbi:ArsR family transcriptional regulator [Halorubellus sp. JP-L1]|nr:ArsR family transcriptional regulator [Halorubellus sp. JP-L1]
MDATSDAFQALAGDPRVRVLAALAGAPDGRATFTELFEATDVDTTAGFAYHLRQLDDRFVRKIPEDDGDGDAYALTDAGRRVARAIEAGAYTDRVDEDPVPLDEDCPLCADPVGLHASVADNVTRVACTACGRDVLALPFPPSGYATRDPETVPEAVDRHHRRRIASFADGVCPDCGAPASGRVESAPNAPDEASGGPDEVADAANAADADPVERHAVRASFACDACSADLSCPLSFVLLDHPAVVAAYHERGVDVRDRPLWTVGVDWRERVLNDDPWCVRTTLRNPNDDDDDDEDDDRDLLAAYVGRDCTVVDVTRLDDAADAGVSAEDDGRITADAANDDAADESTADDGTAA